MSAGARGLVGTFSEAIPLDRRFVEVEVGVEQRHIEMLPLSGALPIEQSSADRTARVGARAHIASGRHREVRRTAGLASHRSDSRIRSTEEIESGLIRERSGLPVSGNRAHHDLRIENLHALIVESHPADDAWREIFDQDIAPANQPLDDVVAFRTFRIQANRLLTAIELHKESTAPVLIK